MKWNNKFIVQTGMVEINAKQCQDREESNQVWFNHHKLPGGECCYWTLKKGWSQAR